MTTTTIAKEINNQALGNDEGLVNLYDLTVQGVTYYFHGEDIDDVLFFRGNNYYGFPMLLEGIEITGDGAQVRPTLTLPNVNSLFKTPETSDYIGIDKLEDLVGGKVTRHQTLAKYVGIGEDSTPTNTNGYELPKATYIIDRVASKNRLMIQLELASPFDLSGVRVPSRQVTGKYCTWYYKGYDYSNTNVRSACTWDCKVTPRGIATVGAAVSQTGITGNYSSATASFTNIPHISTVSGGQGATFDFDIAISSTNLVTVSNVQVNNPGYGYAQQNIIQISHTDITQNSEGQDITAGTITMYVETLEEITANNGLAEKSLFYSIDDEPFIDASNTLISGASTWNNNTATQNQIWLYGGVYYMAKSDTSSTDTPKEKSIYWKIVRPYIHYNDWNSTTTVNTLDPRKNTYIYYNNNIWRALKAGTKAQLGDPSSSNKNFAIADICSKLLSGCKARFQARIISVGSNDIIPSVSVYDNSIPLPFGGFPGTRKYR